MGGLFLEQLVADLTENDEGTRDHPHSGFENGTKWTSESIQLVPDCVKGLWEEEHQMAQKDSSETLSEMHCAWLPSWHQGVSPGWRSLEPTYEYLSAAVVLLSPSVWGSNAVTLPSSEGSHLRLSMLFWFRVQKWLTHFQAQDDCSNHSDLPTSLICRHPPKKEKTSLKWTLIRAW